MPKISAANKKTSLKLTPQTKLSLFCFVIMAVLVVMLLIKSNILSSPFNLNRSGGVITTTALKKILNREELVLINVHTPYEGEISNTDLFVEYDSVKASEERLPKDKNTEIVLYCKSGAMSEQALVTFRDLGYTNVSHLKGGMDRWVEDGEKVLDLAQLPLEVLPEEGFTLPVSWGNLGPKLIELGVIDEVKFTETIQMTDSEKDILTNGTESGIVINSQNSQFVVDLLWALGLAQRSLAYEEGPMGKEYKNEVGNFASTGGWNLAKGDAVQYLNKFDLVGLNSDQQRRVAEIAKNVFRPCCGNSTWFPDCNHGMAALAAIELMVAQNLSDEEVYKNVLKLNSFWFPSNYLTNATYYARQGVSWQEVDAKEVLGSKYSSGKGAADIAKKVGPLPYNESSGGSCGA